MKNLCLLLIAFLNILILKFDQLESEKYFPSVSPLEFDLSVNCLLVSLPLHSLLLLFLNKFEDRKRERDVTSSDVGTSKLISILFNNTTYTAQRTETHITIQLNFSLSLSLQKVITNSNLNGWIHPNNAQSTLFKDGKSTNFLFFLLLCLT